MHTNGQGVLYCSEYVPIDVVRWMTRTGQRDVLVLSRCKNFGDGMGGKRAKKAWAWALGLGSLLLGWQAGRWLWRGSGRLESKCTRGTCGHVRLGGLGRFQWGSPLRVSPGRRISKPAHASFGALKGTFKLIICA